MVWVTRVEFSQGLVDRFDLQGRVDNNKIAQRYAIFVCSLVVEIYTSDSLVGQRQAKRLQRLKIIIVHYNYYNFSTIFSNRQVTWVIS